MAQTCEGDTRTCLACTFVGCALMPYCEVCETPYSSPPPSCRGSGGDAQDSPPHIERPARTAHSPLDASACRACRTRFGRSPGDEALARRLRQEELDAVLTFVMATEQATKQSASDTALALAVAAGGGDVVVAPASEFKTGIVTRGGARVLCFRCPHCGMATEVLEAQLNCKIFICAVNKKTGKQLGQHNEKAAQAALAAGTIFGCAKQYAVKMAGSGAFTVEKCTGK